MPDAQQADPFNFGHPLEHLTKSLNTQRNTKIVAFGSSSTAGNDAGDQRSPSNVTGFR